jgi:hypothetical protein
MLLRFYCLIVQTAIFVYRFATSFDFTILLIRIQSPTTKWHQTLLDKCIRTTLQIPADASGQSLGDRLEGRGKLSDDGTDEIIGG